jgi:SAM-dependent methyltransferase
MNRNELERYFQEDLGWGYGRQSQIIFNFLCQATDAAKGGIVLDSGAGNQRYKPFFENCIYIAQEHPDAGKKNKDITVYDILCDVKTIPLQDECVDIVLSTSSFEHFEFPQEFINEAYRILKPGGSLWINVPFIYNEHETPYHFQHDTRYGLIRHFRHAGFNTFWVKPTTSSTAAGVFALQYGIQEDSHHPMIAGRRIYKIIIQFNKFYCRLLTKLFDRGPYEETKMPIGWIASAKKDGTQQETIRKNMTVKEFLSTFSKLS